MFGSSEIPHSCGRDSALVAAIAPAARVLDPPLGETQ